MSKSLISDERACLICGMTYGLHRHHVFYGSANRALSEKWGCWVYLCARHHNLSNKGVHYNKNLDLKLKQQCQKAWEYQHGTRDEFKAIFGRSYL